MTQAGGSTCGCPVCHLAPRGQPHVSVAFRVSAMFQTGHDAHVTPPGCPCLESAPASPSAALLLPHPSLEGSSLFSTYSTPQAPKVPPRCHFQLTLPPQPLLEPTYIHQKILLLPQFTHLSPILDCEPPKAGAVSALPDPRPGPGSEVDPRWI